MGSGKQRMWGGGRLVSAVHAVLPRVLIVWHLPSRNEIAFKERHYMKKIILLVAVMLSAAMIAGCGDNLPTKPGGGGHPQPYNPGNGQYAPTK
jgi:hypothetical protein